MQRTQAGAFPLEAWPAPGAITDKPTQLAETYGYDASWTLMRRLVSEVGPDRMRLVFKAAAAHQIAFTGRPEPEALPLPDGGVDWREFLDLLEQVGGAREADTLFDTWVLPPSDAGLMAQHAAAIQQYATLVAAGQGRLPRAGVRTPLATWDFALTTIRIAEAQALLQLRGRIQEAAAPLGVAAPQALQASYEAATGDLAPTLLLAQDELTTIAAISSAHAAVVSDHDPFVSIGLLGSAPQAALDAAARAFGSGDDAGARAAAATALATISAASTLGQERVALVVALLAVLLLALAVLAGRRRRGAGDRWRSWPRRPLVHSPATPPRLSRPGPGPSPDQRNHHRDAPPRIVRAARLMEDLRPPSHEILSGDSADVYFARANDVLDREGLDPLVTMEVFTRHEAILCGIDEAKILLAHALADAPAGEAVVEALDDGDRIAPKEIVLRIRARYRRFGLYEHAILARWPSAQPHRPPWCGTDAEAAWPARSSASAPAMSTLTSRTTWTTPRSWAGASGRRRPPAHAWPACG